MDRSSCPAGRHGTYSAYRDGCRCDDAREDYFRYRKPQRLGRAVPRRVPALGYTRMVQALLAIGWPYAEQSRICGAGRSTLEHLAYHPWVSRETALKVDRMFAEFVNVERAGPLGEVVDLRGPSPVTAGQAWAAGYPPPRAWAGVDIHDPAAVPDWIRPDDPDDVVVERVAHGQMPLSALGPYKTKSNRIAVTADHVTAYQQAARRGTSDRALIETWDVSSKVVDRLRSAA